MWTGVHFRKYKWVAATIADMKSPAGALILLLLAAICTGVPTVGQQQTQSPITAVADVSAEDLLARPVGANWTSYNGDYTGRRYSNLREINVANAAQLRAAWVFHPGNSQNLEVTPVVVDGVMYVTSANDVFALDARTGRMVWHYQRPVSSGLLDDAAAHKNRGVALWQHFVYVETDDAHLLCLDARSGGLRWDIEYADKTKHYGATSAPLVVKGAVIVGTSGGDSGVRGFLAAYDAATGKLKWRFWTIPGPGEFGSSSWPGDAYLHGGGTTWMPGTYDPELNTLYWTTSNPAPDFVGDSRPGDDLYTDCVLALNPDTGELKWYFQFTPHDLYDYDANETPVLADVEQSGTVQRLLLTGEPQWLFLCSRPGQRQVHSSHSFRGEIELGQGHRCIRPAHCLWSNPDRGRRSYLSWHQWGHELVFAFLQSRYKVVLCDGSRDLQSVFANPKPFVQGHTYYGTGTKLPPDEHAQKILLALSVADGKPVWRYPQTGQGHSWGGTLTPPVDWCFLEMTADPWKRWMRRPVALSGTSTRVRKCALLR